MTFDCGAGSRAGIPARAWRVLVACAFAAATSACATLDLEPGKGAIGQPPPVVPAEAPRTTGVEKPPSTEHARLVAMMGGEYRAPAVERYLNTVLAKLAAASDSPGEAYRVTILNTPAVNAFALPSGNLYITRGLLALASDTSEVAAVMAHEIGHVTARHASQRAEQEKRQALIRQVSEAIQPRERGRQVSADSKFSLVSFSREQELEADRIGVMTIGKAGYDPHGAARFLASLGRSTALRAMLFNQNRSDANDLNSSHPSTPERIARATAAARQFGAPGIGDAGRDAWLDVIDNIDFGDDPGEGAIRGRTFSHARLGFGFTAPEGFVLENSAQAVLGIAGGGSEALRLDSVQVGADTPLESYLNSGWVDGLQAASIRPQTVNGLPAALATARAGDWSFRVGVIRLGSDVYRLIFAARALNEEIDRKFRDSIESFRRLPPDETSRLRPFRVAVVTAGSGDSIDTLAARMAIADRPRDYFLMLNGLDKSDRLKAGERYKIVVE